MHTAIILGADGNVGRNVAAACAAEGWTVREVTALPNGLHELGDAVVIDCAKPGHEGWGSLTWRNYFLAVQRAATLIDQCNHAPNVRAMVLCSTPWVAVRSRCPYAEAKFLIEQMAHSHNLFGAYPIVVDRIGMQHDALPVGSSSRFEESVRQAPGELGERVVASLLYAVSTHKAGQP